MLGRVELNLYKFGIYFSYFNFVFLSIKCDFEKNIFFSILSYNIVN